MNEALIPGAGQMGMETLTGRSQTTVVREMGSIGVSWGNARGTSRVMRVALYVPKRGTPSSGCQLFGRFAPPIKDGRFCQLSFQPRYWRR